MACVFLCCVCMVRLCMHVEWRCWCVCMYVCAVGGLYVCVHMYGGVGVSGGRWTG